MAPQRSNESDQNDDSKHTHRTSRAYEINDQWYFELRDGGQKGPFDSEEIMQTELTEFIQFHALMNQDNL